MQETKDECSDIPKKKMASIAWREPERSDIPNIEWVIRWMQEMGPIRQEFTQQNGMTIPNLPLNKYGPMQFHRKYEEEDNEEDEEGNKEEEKEGEEEDMG